VIPMTGAIKIKQLAGWERMPEIRLKKEQDLWNLAKTISRPVFQAENVVFRNEHGVITNKIHSCYMVIEGGIVYKFIYDIKEVSK